jgi:hypothetical protein
MLGAIIIAAVRPNPLMPKVRLEPTRSREDRILSPVLLSYRWYWKHVAVMIKGLDSKANTIPPRFVHMQLHWANTASPAPILFPNRPRGVREQDKVARRSAI